MKLVSDYGNQEYAYPSPAQKAGTALFHAETSRRRIFGARPAGDTKNTENYKNLELDLLEWQGNRIPTPRWLDGYEQENYYIGISRQDRANYEWFKGDIEFIPDTKERLQDTPNANLLYYNPDLSIYVFYEE